MGRFSDAELGVIKTLVPSMPSANQLQPYLNRIDESRWYSNFGPLSEELSERLARHLGVSQKNVCLIGNATLGIQSVIELAIKDIEACVELPSFTFAASAMAVHSAGRKMKFVDVDESMRCSPGLEANYVLDVLPFGARAREEPWMKDLTLLIIDGAASFDALRNFGKTSPTNIVWALVISLHATKLIGAGEGGLVVSNDEQLIRNIRAWQNFGFDTSSSNVRNSQFYGTNAKMSEYSCAVGLASLDRWEDIRNSYANLQTKAHRISQNFGLKVHQAMDEMLVNPYWIVQSNDSEITERIIELCERNRIETRLWWQKGCHSMPAFESIARTKLARTEDISSRYVGLPFHLFLPDQYWELIESIFERSVS